MKKNDNGVREKILKGMELTHRKLLKEKQRGSLYLVVSKNGKVVKVLSEEIDDSRNQK